MKLFNKQYLKEFIFEQKCVPWRIHQICRALTHKYIPIKQRYLFSIFITRITNLKKREYIKIWHKAICHNKNLSIFNNAIIELQEYFGLQKEQIEHLLLNSEIMLKDEWVNFFLKNDFEESNIIRFYDSTQQEIFELMCWHYIKFLDGPLQYVFALKIALNNKFTTYLDYGSGIGTGGILFAQNNFSVTLADISTTNLDFCRYRFKKRNLKAEFIDLKNQYLQDKRFDIITCFDVLEHTCEPIKIIISLVNALNDNGLLLLNIPISEDRNRPMHIVKDKKIIEKIDSIGLYYNRLLMQMCKDDIGRDILFLSKQIQ